MLCCSARASVSSSTLSTPRSYSPAWAIASTSSERVIYKEAVIDAVDQEALRIFEEAKRTANEYNVRGDLHTGTNIASFLRVANVMAAHGAI